MPTDTSNKKIPIVLGVAAFLALGSIVFMVVAKYVSLPKFPSKPIELEGEIIPTQPSAPTLSPEKIEIISKLETHIITIQNQSFSPQNLTIKLYDQVKWENKDNETYQIKGENWGNVPIGPGRSFTQAFETAGTYSYSCALHPDLSGTIVVE